MTTSLLSSAQVSAELREFSYLLDKWLLSPNSGRSPPTGKPVTEAQRSDQGLLQILASKAGTVKQIERWLKDHKLHMPAESLQQCFAEALSAAKLAVGSGSPQAAAETLSDKVRDLRANLQRLAKQLGSEQQDSTSPAPQEALSGPIALGWWRWDGEDLPISPQQWRLLRMFWNESTGTFIASSIEVTDVEAEIWPNGVVDCTIRTAISRLNRWFGTNNVPLRARTKKSRMRIHGIGGQK